VRLFEPAIPSTLTLTETFVFRVPAGVTAVHCMLLVQETPVAALEPKKKLVAPAVVSKPAPVMVTTVPPRGVPDAGEIDASDGMYA
jgi:hypothetical protein